MITISKNANINYLAKVVQLKGLKKHSNADRLQCVIIDFQNVITDMKAKDGDVYIYFPIECEINKDFISFINGFREKELNKDKTQVGFFEKNCRVRAMKLRGEKSEGFIVPVKTLEDFFPMSTGRWDMYIGKEFDTLKDADTEEILLCKKYVVKNNQPSTKGNREASKKYGVSRLVEGQVHLHVDTANLRKNIHQIKPGDLVSVSYKLHGTSFWVSNVLVKRKLKWYEKVLKKVGIKIDEMEHDYVYGSRKVVKNRLFDNKITGTDFYKSEGKSVWAEINDEMKGKLPEGFTVYGEAVGFTSSGAPIQKHHSGKPYDYSCEPGKKDVFVYRITFTNSKGYVYNLSAYAIIDFCNRYGLKYVPYLFIGKLKDLFPQIKTDDDWYTNVMAELEKHFKLDDDCWMCKNNLPREGIVIRKEHQFDFEPYKLKSFRFLDDESKQLDTGEVDMESEN